MFSTVLTGIKALKPECNAFFLIPADIPQVRPHTVAAIQNAYRKGKGKIIYPFYGGERGHPPLISTEFIPKILNWEKGGGLRACLMQFEKDAYNVKVCDEGIHMDADIPDDYKRILKKKECSDLPTTGECLCLLKQILKLDITIINHCVKTAETADLLCRSLRAKQANINCDLAKKAALLHDMARNKKNHAHSGSKTLKEMGFDAIADIIQNHMDITTDPDLPLNEKEIVFFADKLTVNDTLEIDYEKRFTEKAKAHIGNPAAENAIKKRLAAARIIHHKIEATTGIKLPEILQIKG
jgi:putative nucleotidyltransferase with HDIG domain